MRVELSKFAVSNLDMLERVVAETIKESEQAQDPIYISDFLLGGAGDIAAKLMNELREDTREMYTLHCLRDEWGNVPQEGDIVKRRFKRQLIKDGVPLSSKKERQWMAWGTYDEMMNKYKDYVVDERGCIKCTYADAEYFLMQNGIHSKSNIPISQHTIPAINKESGEPLKRDELSKSPAKAENGDYLHVWYWRFKEVETTAYPYDKLELRKKDDKPKRGHTPKPKETSVSI